MNKTECEKAIAMLQELEGPSREVDFAIARVLSKSARAVPVQFLRLGQAAETTPHFTSDLNAVVELVERELPGWGWDIRNNRVFFKGDMWKEHHTIGRDLTGISQATPAIALLSAFFNAKLWELENGKD